MNFYFGQRNHHPVLQQIIHALEATITPPQEGDKGHRPTIVYTFIDELSDTPGVLFSMGSGDGHRQHSALVTLQLGREHGTFHSTVLQLQKIDLQLRRTNTTGPYDHSTGDQSNSYSRNVVGDRAHVNLDEFCPQLGESLRLFFTHGHPPALPEFSPWLHH
jgi:hypothetical protein